MDAKTLRTNRKHTWKTRIKAGGGGALLALFMAFLGAMAVVLPFGTMLIPTFVAYFLSEYTVYTVANVFEYAVPLTSTQLLFAAVLISVIPWIRWMQTWALIAGAVLAWMMF